MTKEYQSHSGAVNTSTTPSVQYAFSEFTAGNNSRPTSMTYPNGRVLAYNYATGVDTAISRLSSHSSCALANPGEPGEPGEPGDESDARQVLVRATRLTGELTAKEVQKVHEMKLTAGKRYVIDLESNAFDTFLRLEDAQGKKLAENDDIVERVNLNSRIVFTPQKDGAYRLVATAFQGQGRGPYTLTVREFIGENAAK